MRQRLQQGAPGTLTVTFTDSDGSPADAAGAVTVGVKAADGSVVLAPATATTHGAANSGTYTVALSAAQTASLNLLTATWTDAGNARVVTSVHEVVGGFYFSLKEARGSNGGLIADVAKYSDDTLRDNRYEVEVECERMCQVAFVPRYARETVDGSGTDAVTLPQNAIRTIRSVRVYTTTGGTQYTAFTAAQLASIVADESGTLHRTDFGVFNEGRGNVVIEFEHGLDAPPADVRRASLIRLRSRLNLEKTGLDNRATSYTAENGQVIQLATASAFSTGIPDVDAAYERYSFRESGEGGLRAVSRPLVFANQRYSVFHGS